MFFSDEAKFNNSGGVNRHNCHYYFQKNPHWQRSEELQWSVNVWAGIIRNHVIDAYIFFQDNGQNYSNFLQNQLPIILKDVSFHTRIRM